MQLQIRSDNKIKTLEHLTEIIPKLAYSIWRAQISHRGIEVIIFNRKSSNKSFMFTRGPNPDS